MSFQFLIGKVKSDIFTNQLKGKTMFQFLIGKVKSQITILI